MASMEQTALIVSIVSGVAGVVALVVALRANNFSKRSLAKALEANEYSERAESRELERNDVDWDYRSAGFGVVVFVNEGQDTAYNVRAVVGVGDGRKLVATADEVVHSERLRFEFPAEAQDRLRRVREAESRLGTFQVPDMNLQMGEFLDVKITWQTGRGRHASWEPRLANSDLGVTA